MTELKRPNPYRPKDIKEEKRTVLPPLIPPNKPPEDDLVRIHRDHEEGS